MTNALEVINRRWEDAEDWISDLEDTVVEITQLEWQKIKIKKKLNEDSLRDLWDSIKHRDVCVIGVP